VKLPDRTRLGIGVSRESIRVVAVRGRTVLWTSECVNGDDNVPFDSLLAVLRKSMPWQFPRPVAVASLGPSMARIKSVHGVPPVATSLLAADIVRANCTRFLPRFSEARFVGAVQSNDRTRIWAITALQSPMDAVERACRATGVRLVGFVAAPLVLGAALRARSSGQCFAWQDGDVTATVELNEKGIVSKIAYRPDTASATTPPCVASEFCDELIASRPERWRFADAYGAAVLGRHAPIFCATNTNKATTGRAVPRRRFVVAGLAFVLGLLAVAAVPILSPKVARLRDESQLRALSSSGRAALAREAALRRQADAIKRASDFLMKSRSSLALLRQITNALPSEVALVSLHIDSAGGVIIAIGDGVARAVTGLDSVAAITSPHLSSPVTREVVGGQEMERAAIAFGIRRYQSHSIGLPSVPSDAR
jgi:hypothetical protein